MELSELDKIAYDFLAVMTNRKLSIKEALYVLEVCRLDAIRADAETQNPFSVANLRKANLGKSKQKKEGDKNEEKEKMD